MADSSQKGSGRGIAPDFLVWFGILCALSLACDRIYRQRLRRAQEEKATQAPKPAMPPAEIAALVTRLAKSVLGIGPDQLGESMEQLQIPRGDLFSFLDDLEQDHGLEVPSSARSMSTSIAGVISALSRGD